MLDKVLSNQYRKSVKFHQILCAAKTERPLLTMAISLRQSQLFKLLEKSLKERMTTLLFLGNFPAETRDCCDPNLKTSDSTGTYC
jgi:hypothetical protein